MTEETVATPKKPAKRTSRTRSVIHHHGVVDGAPDRTSLDIRKPIETIIVRNRNSSQITLTERKAVNNILGYAQHINRNSPDIEIETYSMPLGEFEQVMGFTPNNRPHLIKTLRTIQDMKVEFNFDQVEKNKGRAAGRATKIRPAEEDTEQYWGIANIISEIYLDSKSKMIHFSLPPKAKKVLLRPEHFNRIQSILLNQFTSHAGMVLYEVVSMYFTAPVRRTKQMHWEVWSMSLSGASTPHSTYREFNKMLVRAIDQVNGLIAGEGFRIMPHKVMNGKKTESLWFEIEQLNQSSLGLEGMPMAVGGEAHQKLAELGFTNVDIQDLILRYGEEYVMAQYDYFVKRTRQKKLEPIKAPKAFFLSSLENNFADAPRRAQADMEREEPKRQEAAEAKAKRNTETIMSDIKKEWWAKKTQEITASFEAQSPETQLQIVADIETDLQATGPQVWKSYQKRGVDDPLVKNAIIRIIVGKNVTEPTAEELLFFAVQNGLLTPGGQQD